MTPELVEIKRETANFLCEQAERINFLVNLWYIDGPSAETNAVIHKACEQAEALREQAATLEDGFSEIVVLTEKERVMLALAAKHKIRAMKADREANPQKFEDMGYSSCLEALERAQSKLG